MVKSELIDLIMRNVLEKLVIQAYEYVVIFVDPWNFVLNGISLLVADCSSIALSKTGTWRCADLETLKY